MSDNTAPVIALADLEDDADDEFYPCEETTDLVGIARFGTTSRHVLATWLPAAFRKWGVRFALVEGWEDRGRPMSTGYFDPNALLNHHTGTTSSEEKPAPSLATVVNGRSDLSGPLCQVATDYNGLTYIVAAGRANHAGTAKAAMGNPSGDGNAMYIGNEIMTSGLQRMPKAQYDAVVLVSAAILDHFGYTGATKLGLHHTTSTSGKWDLGAGTGDAGVPYSVTKLRSDVAARLVAGPPATTVKDWFDMATLADLKTALKDPEVLREIARFVWTGYAFGPEGSQKVPAGYLTLQEQLTRIAIQAANDDLTPEEVKAALAEVVTSGLKVEGEVHLVPRAPAPVEGAQS